MPSPFEWSTEMDNLFWTTVTKVVLDDPRTDWSENLSLGFPFDVIREQVIGKGLADFSTAHLDDRFGALTAAEKVLLNCFVNLKKHFFACYATFEQYRRDIERVFGATALPTVFDVGCGPGTACLALCDLLPGRAFEYVGIDSADAMRRKGHELWAAARDRGLLSPNAVARFFESWEAFPAESLRQDATIVALFSYFFASQSLTFHALRSLAAWCQSLRTRTAQPIVMVVYLNSTIPLANRNYEVFKGLLGIDPESSTPARSTIEYRKKRGGPVTGKEEFLHELIFLKGK